ncbi:hypothetical protein IG197_20035 [Aminobacter sp. SR38]|uniref:DUF4209 domain-containing protein n=1 Tax=unclassified Aminobacter TaxID=2644704 RepID=UPI0012B0BE7E|nr:MULTISPECIES: DUF4209 domain-containing protein [unclassified Aminobacter]MRX37035.1 hypothetical protein [Aminobacter sp. MDW-2]QNH35013.1 hypothetical protein H5P29_03480 [Aminobacter sp. MDW-2]QOF70102.1 hypothetical protein IG197_20035 [Aminobacter sp. SR38]
MSEQESSSNTQIPGVNYVVPLSSFQLEAVKAAVAASKVADSLDVYARIRTAVVDIRTAGGDDESERALGVLSQVSGYHFKPDDRIEPFGPLAVMDGRRSAIPTDLLADQVGILSQFAPEVGHPAFRARIADVCWLLNKKDTASGLRAMASYVECVRAVLNAEAHFDFEQTNPASVPAAEYLTRAAAIARAMGWKREEFDPLRQIIAEVSQFALDNDDGWGFIHIGPINLGTEVWDYAQLGQAAEILVASDKLARDHPGRRALWDLAARAYHRAKDSNSSNRCLIEAAETYVADADARPDSAFVQTHFLNDAIQALRPLPGTAGRRQALQDRLNSIQPRITDEMSSFSHETNITELVEATEAAVRNKTLAETVRALFMCEKSPDPDKLRDEVLSAAYGSISAIFSTTVSDSQGRTRFIAPGLAPAGPPNENQVRFLVNQHDRIRRSLVVSGRIDPIRRVLWEEHSVSVEALLPLMQASPFVPPNHQHTFAIGAARFIGGDELEAAHLILPQLENSLRHILNLEGVETNRINQDGTQEEAMLSRILEDFREALLRLMPPALVQEIELLFNFRGGPSIRHELAHGKMSDGEFWSPDVTYSIWLVLHIATLPTLRHWDEVAARISRRSRRVS